MISTADRIGADSSARKGSTQQVYWRERYKAASVGLLGTAAFLATLDYFARFPDQRTTSVLFLALALALAAGGAWFVDWDRVKPVWRLSPAVAVLLAMLASIFWANSAGQPHSDVGFVSGAVLILCYIGFVLPPGSALTFSPLVIGVLFIAYLREPVQVGLEYPLIGVPIAAGIGELIAALVDRSRRTADWFSSRSQRLAILEDVLRRFRRPSSLNEAANEVAKAATEIFETDRATVVLRDTVGGLIPVTIGPIRDQEPDAATSRLVAEAITGDEPRIVPNGEESILVLPLPAADAPAGAVVVQPITKNDPDFTLDLARLFGTQVGIAIEHLFVINQLERATTRDELTGIGNRKHADALLNSLQEGDALILLDLDGFKSVNDTLGHAAGDRVLLDLSGHLQQCVRDSDASARLGGDEFLVVARRAFADPIKVAERIIKGWEFQQRSTTLSAGVALHDQDVDIAETFDRADQALYKAKASGKNQAMMWEPQLQQHS